ncbi:NUDIX domain-containing protein [Pseudonocardiaceae bacterium YIM PH 21723]|nr:NUDIX domain-containing protein [Pseudonocardiaceae bacterium YIM PH 21723]
MRSEGLWHAGTAVMLLSPDRHKVYVHQRSWDKDVFPGVYDCWSGGLLAPGETPMTGALRELREELGVDEVELEQLGANIYCEPPIRYFCVAYEAIWDGPITHQPEEIIDGWWMPLNELRLRLTNPEAFPFVPDGRQLIDWWFANRHQDA